ncbi:MAG: hypothetical protein Q4A25_01875 [Candidatus Saccharibacteria bacterium]|nr:hypothetical protein [Candidatus Saccharibacteria bacterium]
MTTKKFLKILIWTTIIIFSLRLLLSLSEVTDKLFVHDTIGAVYVLFSFASEAITISAVFGWLFNRYLWRNKIISELIGVPILRKQYSGELFSNYDNKSGKNLKRKPHEIEVSFSQTLLSLSMSLKTKESKSQSVDIAIKQDGSGQKLIATYFNEPGAMVRKRSPIHYGTALLCVNDDGTISGNYYTDRGTFGELELKPKPKSK